MPPRILAEVRFDIPGPPKAQGRAKTRIVTAKGTGRQFASIYTPASSRKEAGEVRYLASRQMGDRVPFEGPIQINLSFLLAIPTSFSKKARREALAGWQFPAKKPDYDNLAKLICDAMNGIVYRDDSQIVTAFITKRYSEQPTVLVSVKALATGEPVLEV